MINERPAGGGRGGGRLWNATTTELITKSFPARRRPTQSSPAAAAGGSWMRDCPRYFWHAHRFANLFIHFYLSSVQFIVFIKSRSLSADLMWCDHNITHIICFARSIPFQYGIFQFSSSTWRNGIIFPKTEIFNLLIWNKYDIFISHLDWNPETEFGRAQPAEKPRRRVDGDSFKNELRLF